MNDFLVDTQALVWFFENDTRLPKSIKRLMEQSDRLLVSIASFWEITIKQSINKLHLSFNIASLMDATVDSGFEIIPIEVNHLTVLSQLEFIHRDPFDRLIISQSIAEELQLISSDHIFQEYPVNVIWQ